MYLNPSRPKPIKLSLSYSESREIQDINDALLEITDRINSIIGCINSIYREPFPSAKELPKIKYETRMNELAEKLIRADKYGKTKFIIKLTPGHPESEQLHDSEIEFLENNGYKLTIKYNKDTSYEATIRW